jgi:hypothetical protein
MPHQELALRLTWKNGVSNLATPNYWLAGIAFLATYLVLNILTVRYEFHGHCQTKFYTAIWRSEAR